MSTPPNCRSGDVLACFPLLLLAVSLTEAAAIGSGEAPEGVSPGAADHIAASATHCPTFSWGAVADAERYEIVFYELAAGTGVDLGLTLAPEDEVLFTTVVGKSVPTAAAAVRGSSPDPVGEAYGVVGISASVDGAACSTDAETAAIAATHATSAAHDGKPIPVAGRRPLDEVLDRDRDPVCQGLGSGGTVGWPSAIQRVMPSRTL